MSHTYELVLLHTWKAHLKHLNEPWLIYEGVIPHIWISHVKYLDESYSFESRHTHERFMSRKRINQLSICMSHTRHVTNPLYFTHAYIMSHIWMSHVTIMNESCHTYEWVMPHIWMSHVTIMKWVVPHTWMSHVTHMNEAHTRTHTYTHAHKHTPP